MLIGARPGAAPVLPLPNRFIREEDLVKTIGNKLLVLILTIGVFGILNTEMGIVGVIPYVSELYGVSVARAGQLVSGFALIVAIAGPTMPLLFSRVNRKTVMLLALGIFTVCNLFAVVAPSFELLLAARVIPAAFHPLYVSMAMAVAQQTGDTPAERTKNSAQVFVGVSAGMVVGAPVAGMLAENVSLSAAMLFFGLVTLAAFVLTVLFVPSMPVERPMSYGDQLAVFRKPVFIVSLLAAAAVNAGMFGFYSYLSDYLGGIGFAATLVSALLFAYGMANIVGNMIAGRALGASPSTTMTVAPMVLIVLYLALFAAGVSGTQLAVAALLIALGVAVGAANTVDQYLVSRAAPEAPDFANGLFLTATNLGTTVGTTVCGNLITTGGTQLSVMGAVPCVILGLACVIVRLRLTSGAHGKLAAYTIGSNR